MNFGAEFLENHQGLREGHERPQQRPPFDADSVLIADSCKSSQPLWNPDPTPSTTSVSGVGIPQRQEQLVRNHQSNDQREWAALDSKKFIKNIVLTERDRSLFRLCREQKFLLMEHCSLFFGSIHERKVRERIQELTEARFFRFEHHPEFGSKRVLRLSPRGLSEARRNSEREVKDVARLNPAQLFHDAFVTETRLRLSKFFRAQFVSEQSIRKSDLSVIPDGVFYFESGRALAIEVENSIKGIQRFLRLAERWTEKDCNPVVAVLYVASNKSIFRSIQKYLPRLPESPPMGMICLEDLRLSHRPLVDTKRGSMDWLAKESL